MNNMQHNEPKMKKEYNSPELITFGDVRTLTQSGSGTSSEGSNPKDLFKDPLKHP